jgi:N-acetylmuramoyl-L-alanine amidase
MANMKLATTLKRALVLALALALMAGIFTVSMAATKGGNYYCIANRVNLRSGPSSAYSIEAKLMKGDVVTYIGKSNGWYKVSFYDKKSHTSVNGYVYRKYLSAVAPSKSSGSSISTTTTYKTTVNLRVRSEPSITSGYVRTKLKSGTKVSVVKQKKSWVYVTYKGGSGWVSAKYLKKVYK